MSELNNIALKIIGNGKGILAADESTGTMTKRLNSVRVESNAQNRLLFRETLFSSSSMKNCIGGVILYDETIKQSSSLGKKVPELISDSNAVPGIKVDTGAKTLANSPEEKITEGLDGLRERLKEYYKLGARFAKWRGVYIISEKYPSKISIYSNAHALARYSALVQESGMVPIVEPELLMDGSHNSEDCLQKTSEVVKKCYEQLELHKVELKGTILKPNMILPGTDSGEKIDTLKIAEMTIKCLEESVPSEVPGIAFLSGGQSEKQATKNLNQINVKNKTNFIMTYSYGRALQQSALKFWSKDLKNIKGTQEVFNHRAKMCSLASKGEWSEEVEKI
ncbi:MAG TPA: class I fructose-bisphosphate aldolase [Candidatus Pelagibacter bacterium]|jgi:fructose-bisphosphate aldolase class I|nr:fructose-bisphosphate aldolase class I [Pelagibacteraceae bacterium]HJN84288.1 class I fructose-bisphosphate aldolase [Candidatus Pelagibacter bacterium]|tara:strand:- start:477 stop:1487 length:1011 start_codon:yes stop_codon:yes gene_type:complete